MNNVQRRADPIGRTIDKAGERPGGGGMEARVAKLETDVNAIKVDVAGVKANGATKSDVVEAKSAIILWAAGAILVAQFTSSLVKLVEKYI
jgi:hypothetical protein